MKTPLRLILLATLGLALVGCNDDDDDDDIIIGPTPTPTVSPTPTPGTSPTPTPTPGDSNNTTSAPLTDGTQELVEITDFSTGEDVTTVTVIRDNGEQWNLVLAGVAEGAIGEGLVVSADSGIFGDTEGTVTFESGTTLAIDAATRLL